MSVTEKLAESASLLADLLAGRLPDERGRFGPYGGRFVPETLIPAHERLERGVRRWLVDAEFQAELGRELRDWVGRPTALSPAPHLSRRWGAEVWLKREDLAHTGAHKINNAIGQALLARRLGARRVVAARRAALRRLHGGSGHGAPGTQRGPHEIAWRQGHRGDQRRSDLALGHR
jgi:hypothetical protein